MDQDSVILDEEQSEQGKETILNALHDGAVVYTEDKVYSEYDAARIPPADTLGWR